VDGTVTRSQGRGRSIRQLIFIHRVLAKAYRLEPLNLSSKQAATPSAHHLDRAALISLNGSAPRAAESSE
jgi:hypothetical protein